MPSTSRASDPIASVSSKGKRTSSKLPLKSPEHINIEIKKGKVSSLQAVGTTTIEKSKSSGRIKFLSDSSDSELELEIIDSKIQDEGKRNRSDSSEKENGTMKKRRLLDSDEEEDPLTSQDTELKHATTIISDDEEEPTQKERNQQRSSRVIISDDED
ncbi:uncharacterized protein LOC122396121 [Colletes gigas]|uniref:uncharacterized protein LOC122396121 n=1 Tax=Colletes gigas TaxID=935657 RepID=UPI001C9AFF33|nr:uncharacterized protein LOC122396121 [Colletes gigas]